MIPNNLLAQPTPFVGRAKELSDIVQLLADPACRLLTLVGAGGIGKTRLSLELGRAMTEATSAFTDGVYFIPLQSLHTPDLLIPTIGDAAGFQFYQGSEIKRQLLEYLHERKILLILDNLEQ